VEHLKAIPSPWWSESELKVLLKSLNWKWRIYMLDLCGDKHYSDPCMLYINAEHGWQRKYGRNELLWVTVIIRMPVLMAATEGKCWSSHWHHMLCQQTMKQMSEGNWHCIQGGTYCTKRCVMLLSEHLYPQSLSNYSALYVVHCIPTAFSPDLTYDAREEGLTRLAVVSNQL